MIEPFQMPFAITMNTFGVLKSVWPISNAVSIAVAFTAIEKPLFGSTAGSTDVM
jgi:hypothetical protein